MSREAHVRICEGVRVKFPRATRPLLVQVDLGFGVWTRQYLRLRGIDCPEIYTSAGKRAKRFVDSEFSRVPYVVISSSRSDKYDRYLADIFYENKTGEQFLNNKLLQARLAVRV